MLYDRCMYVHACGHITVFSCSEDSSDHTHLLTTGKVTNPYVSSPKKTRQAKTTAVSSAPTDETTINRCVECIRIYEHIAQ